MRYSQPRKVSQRKRRGIAVVLVIGFVVVATAILTVSIQQFVAEKRLTRARWHRVQLEQWMESALERTMELRKQDKDFLGDRWSITSAPPSRVGNGSSAVFDVEGQEDAQDDAQAEDDVADRFVATSQVIDLATDLDPGLMRVLLRLENTRTDYFIEESFDVAR